MRKAAFEVREGDERVEITVIDLAKGAGDRLDNINAVFDRMRAGAIDGRVVMRIGS